MVKIIDEDIVFEPVNTAIWPICEGFLFANGRMQFVLLLSLSWYPRLDLQTPTLAKDSPGTVLGKYFNRQDRCSYLLEDGSYLSASLKRGVESGINTWIVDFTISKETRWLNGVLAKV